MVLNELFSNFEPLYCRYLYQCGHYISPKVELVCQKHNAIFIVDVPVYSYRIFVVLLLAILLLS